ncbi:sulfate/molybdate ABC transporter ATP-binding protein [uncultured Alsobacter sp.]|uniref:sulfate/molybdate ABC transporter ATP-binding protein n=1 Tax=uncultured Alsobacter sp. TaxID=1748258 RepID=UPI0025EA26DB|nr:sulfate/molybdate ABC transporter ATP-binding protein [uncultured Alsobacter sp.]
MGIRASGIHKQFGAHAALAGVDLDIAEGELIALLGPSGSGKTTLLRIIAGLEHADAGTIALRGEDATLTRVQDRGVGFVFQHYALFKHLTVFENVAYGLRVRPRRTRPTETQIRARVLELLHLVQLDGLEGRYPAQLSGGQRQRVALARALAIDPTVLLLDEPFGALDAKVRKELRRWLREIHHKTGQTTVFVTHDQDEALELADRVAILNRGRLEQVGSADDIYDNPASAFVMGFVGDATALPVQVRHGRPYLDGEALAIPATPCADGAGHLYLRPGGVALAPAGRGHLQGTVTSVRRTGAGRRAEITVAGLVVDIDVPHGAVVAQGADAGITVERCWIFPA